MTTVLAHAPGRRWAVEMVSGIALAGFAALLVVRLGDIDNIVKATLLLVLVGVGLAVLRRPERLLTLLVVAAPFNYSVTLIGFEVSTNDVLLFSVAVILAPKVRLRSLPPWLRFGAVAVVVGSGAAALLSADPAIAAYGCLRYTAAMVVLLAAVTLLPTRSDAVRRLGLLVSCAAVGVLVGALIQRAGIQAPPLGAPFSSDRLDSTFGYYTQYAGFMAIALVVAISGLWDAIQRSARLEVLVFASGAASAGAGLGLSLSRGALAGAAAGLLFLLILHTRRPSALIGVLMIGAVVVGGAWAVTPAPSRTAFVERLTSDQGGDTTRRTLQESGLQAATDMPFGLGFGNFPDYLERYDRSPEVSLPFFHAHRTPTQLALDAGWVGFVGFFLLLLTPLWLMLRRVCSGPVDSVGIGFSAALVVFLVQGWNDYLFHETAFVVLALVLAWASYTSALGVVEPPRTPERRQHVLVRAGGQ